MVCTPHLGASTTEAQEGVSIEVVEAVVDALMGKLSATAVNAPLVPAEILKELQPFVQLAEGLGKVGTTVCDKLLMLSVASRKQQRMVLLCCTIVASTYTYAQACCQACLALWCFQSHTTCLYLGHFEVPSCYCDRLQGAVSLVADQGFTDINICYSSPRGDDLDTRLLRAMVVKGILEDITTAKVNLVNADLLAKNRGLRISEVTIRSEGRSVN